MYVKVAVLTSRGRAFQRRTDCIRNQACMPEEL